MLSVPGDRGAFEKSAGWCGKPCGETAPWWGQWDVLQYQGAATGRGVVSFTSCDLRQVPSLWNFLISVMGLISPRAVVKEISAVLPGLLKSSTLSSALQGAEMEWRIRRSWVQVSYSRGPPLDELMAALRPVLPWCLSHPWLCILVPPVWRVLGWSK